jgi:hypothetical protein
MLDIQIFFSHIDEFICPELFSIELEGFARLENVWDILKRIQKGFTASRV